MLVVNPRQSMHLFIVGRKYSTSNDLSNSHFKSENFAEHKSNVVASRRFTLENMFRVSKKAHKPSFELGFDLRLSVGANAQTKSPAVEVASLGFKLVDIFQQSFDLCTYDLMN